MSNTNSIANLTRSSLTPNGNKTFATFATFFGTAALFYITDNTKNPNAKAMKVLTGGPDAPALSVDYTLNVVRDICSQFGVTLGSHKAGSHYNIFDLTPGETESLTMGLAQISIGELGARVLRAMTKQEELLLKAESTETI